MATVIPKVRILQQDTLPSTKSLILGAKELSHMLQVADKPQDIFVPNNSSLIHRSPQISSHDKQVGGS